MRHRFDTGCDQSGFTLIELMIAVAIVALLLTVALPSYQQSTLKARRADAVAALTRLQFAQEQFRANNIAYAATVAALPASQASTSPDNHYGLAVNSAGPSGYTLTATAQSGSPQFGDLKCRGLRVVMSAGNLSYLSLNDAGTVDSSKPNPCWSR